MSYHTIASMILFEAIYGQFPPSLQQHLPEETNAEALAQEIKTRDELTYNLKGLNSKWSELQ